MGESSGAVVEDVGRIESGSGEGNTRRREKDVNCSSEWTFFQNWH
jgi:hypothetical protein